MSEDNRKALPKDSDSDYSMPGRFEESSFRSVDSWSFEGGGSPEHVDILPAESKLKNRHIVIMIVAFVVVSAGIFSYYFANQGEIDSKIIQNMRGMSPESILAEQYGVGEYGGDHAHAAIAVFVDGEQVNFGLQRFQLSSKYIHFEDNNPYIIHRHATGVPLDMLFVSFGLKITPNCIMWDFDRTAETKNRIFCTDDGEPLIFFVNGEEYRGDISQYVIEHNDRVLISYGDSSSLSKHLAYLESLEIFDVPKRTPQYSQNEIFV